MPQAHLILGVLTDPPGQDKPSARSAQEVPLSEKKASQAIHVKRSRAIWRRASDFVVGLCNGPLVHLQKQN